MSALVGEMCMETKEKKGGRGRGGYGKEVEPLCYDDRGL